MSRGRLIQVVFRARKITLWKGPGQIGQQGTWALGRLSFIIYINSSACALLERAEAQRWRGGGAYATPAHLLSFASGLQLRPASFRSQIIRSTGWRQRKRPAQHMRSDSLLSRTSIADCPRIMLRARAFDFRRRAVSDSAAISWPQSHDARAAPAATNRTRRMRPRPGNSAQRCSQAANRAA